MSKYSNSELSMAIKVVNSTIIKCENMHSKFKVGSSHHALLINRLNALIVSKILIENEISENDSNSVNEFYESNGTNNLDANIDVDLDTALKPILSIIHKCKRAQNKFEIDSLNYKRFTKLILSMTICEFLMRDKLSKEK